MQMVRIRYDGSVKLKIPWYTCTWSFDAPMPNCSPSVLTSSVSLSITAGTTIQYVHNLFSLVNVFP